MNHSSEHEAIPANANVLAQSRVFHLDQMPVRKMANGGRSWDVVRGVLATGEVIAIHESEQPAGLAPNPAHTIEHTEFITIIEGTLEFTYDGKAERVGPGGVLYVAPGTMHQVKNIGDGPARYVVVAIGGDVKR
ncbi:cupin domain-containing protein [Edaphobacter sp.]|uniref:cupin domain-containing protein n=1 Tax=Edaphobacter sp. TaxID=1934404 RepID=UPI002DB6BB88|nr:cupin domain-containing protein [Edaphobacter sp.]HEU5340232.1 cupin domain-containing protein [Edaphobacter sp.]